MTDKKPEPSVDEIVADAERWLADKFEEDACSMKSKIGRLCMIFREPTIARLAARLIVKPNMKMKTVREMMSKYINENESVAETLRAKGHELPIEFCHAEFLTAVRKGFEADKVLFADSLRVMDRSSRAMKERIRKRKSSGEASPAAEAPVAKPVADPPTKKPIPPLSRNELPPPRPPFQRKEMPLVRHGVVDSAPARRNEEEPLFGEFELDR